MYIGDACCQNDCKSVINLSNISYYFYKDTFNYGEDNNWYIFENHKWKNIGNKNPDLRYETEIKLVDSYKKLIKYYKDIF